MKTIDIKGKPYVTVAERVKELHRLYPHSEIITEILEEYPRNNEVKSRITVKATVKIYTETDGVVDKNSVRIFTGHSQAEWGKGMMGDVALEIAETSAVGRALGFANIGLVEGIASADEVKKAGKSVTDEPPF